MAEGSEMLRYYTPEMVEAAMDIWMRSSVSLIDIRCRTITRKQPLVRYLLPGSMLLYTSGAPASITLNEAAYQTGPFGLCHAGKGTLLSVAPLEEEIQTYMVLYKAEAAPFYRRNLRNLLEAMNPFTQVYGFTPANPVFFMEKFRAMDESWHAKARLQQFYAKAVLYQVIHQIYMELGQGDIRYIEPDYVEWVKDYLDQHYTEPISIQALSEMLPLSRSLLGRMFRKREQRSLQEYLNHKRLEAAKAYLRTTNANMHEVAFGCGFLDEINLIRSFKKHVGLTPGEYRRKSAMKCTENVIDSNSQRLYNEEGLEHSVKSQRDGAFTMFGQTRSKEMIVAAAMSVMLLLSACASQAPASNSGAANQAAAGQTQATPAAAQAAESGGTEHAAQTRVVQTPMGEVEVPLDPKRIVVNSWWVGDVVAFGVTPVAIQPLYATGNGYEDKTEGVKRLAQWEAEDIMAESPDLIITGYERNYDDLRKIAPTVYIPYDMPDAERLPLIAQVLGKEAAEGTALLEAFNQRVEEAKARLGEAGILDKTITVGRYGGDEGFEMQWSNWWGGSIVYDKLGMPLPEGLEAIKAERTDAFSDLFSFEVIPQYIGDYVLINGVNGADEDEALKKSPIWQAIPAIMNGHVIEMEAAVLFFNDISSQNVQLDLISEALLALTVQSAQ